MARQRKPAKPISLGSRIARELMEEIAEDFSGQRRKNFNRLVEQAKEQSLRMAHNAAKLEAPTPDSPEIGQRVQAGCVLQATSKTLGEALDRSMSAEMAKAKIREITISTAHKVALY
jgi:hypothetical protein